jgi:electron transfer flavoprotein beta subunit
MNPFDELSVEESVRIREKSRAPGGVEDICVLSAGPPKAQDILRTAMAMGADRAIHVDVKDELEPLAVAKLLKAAAEQQKSNLVILGKQSIDDDANQTGQMLAGLLGWPQATQASKVEFGEGDVVSVTREVDGGVETVRAKLPMIITTDLRLNEPRYASLPNIMKAKKKPLEKKTLADFGVSTEKRLKVLKVTGELCASGAVRIFRLWLTLHRATCEARRRQGRGRGRSHFQAQGARRYLEDRTRPCMYYVLSHAIDMAACCDVVGSAAMRYV